VERGARIIINEAYPGPESGTSPMDLYPQYFVDQLEIPAASGAGGVVTGQLLINGDTTKPLIAVLYLSAVTPNSDPNLPPTVNFKQNSDPIATEEITSGKFAFSDISPGQYALVAWNPSDSSIIENNSGNILVIEVKANVVFDLGVVPINQ
jgi:hypothetical protein